MLGDPGTAKSQLLKFVEKCSPIGVSGLGHLLPAGCPSKEDAASRTGGRGPGHPRWWRCRTSFLFLAAVVGGERGDLRACVGLGWGRAHWTEAGGLSQGRSGQGILSKSPDLPERHFIHLLNDDVGDNYSEDQGPGPAEVLGVFTEPPSSAVGTSPHVMPGEQNRDLSSQAPLLLRTRTGPHSREPGPCVEWVWSGHVGEGVVAVGGDRLRSGWGEWRERAVLTPALPGV